MVRVAGFEPTASWTRRELEHFFQCFLLAFGRFRSDSLTLQPPLNAGFPCAPGLYVVGSVVKNALRPLPGSRQGRGAFCLFWIVCIVPLNAD